MKVVLKEDITIGNIVLKSGSDHCLVGIQSINKEDFYVIEPAELNGQVIKIRRDKAEKV